jgi:hypothetical protein
MWQDVVVPKRWNDGDGKTMEVFVAGEGIDKLVDEELVRGQHLFGRAGQLFVGVMAGRVASPYDKINLVSEVLLYPGEGGVDEGDRCIAV